MSVTAAYFPCGHCSSEPQKIGCSQCNKMTCAQCHRLDLEDNILCDLCHRSKFPEDYTYSFAIPDRKDTKPVVKLTNDALNDIKQSWNKKQKMKTKIIPSWTNSRIIKAFHDSEMKEFISSLNDVKKYGSGYVLSYYVEPFDIDLKKIIDRFDEKKYFYSLRDLYLDKDNCNKRMLYLKVWNSDPRIDPKRKNSWGEIHPYRVIYSNLE